MYLSFFGQFFFSWVEFSQAIFDEALELEVIASKPNVAAITIKECPALAKRPAQSQLNSNKLRTNCGINASDCLLRIRSSLTAIKTKRPS